MSRGRPRATLAPPAPAEPRRVRPTARVAAVGTATSGTVLAPERPAPAPRPGDAEAWERTLAELERDVVLAEQLAAGADLVGTEDAVEAQVARAAAWSMPADLGPMPEHMADQARMLLDRQIATAEHLARSMVLTRQQMAYTDRLRADQKRARAGAAFIDQAV